MTREDFNYGICDSHENGPPRKHIHMTVTRIGYRRTGGAQYSGDTHRRRMGIREAGMWRRRQSP